MIEVDEPDADEMGGQTSYTYIMDGAKTTLTPMNEEYDAKEEQGFGVRYDASGNIKTFRNLTAVSLTQLNTWTALAENKTYTVSEEVQVCLYQNGEYYPTNLSSINAEDYTLTGYYDDFGCTAGQQIRVIVAKPK